MAAVANPRRAKVTSAGGPNVPVVTDPRIAVVRNEPDPDHAFHCDALAGHVPGAVEVAYPTGERPDLDAVDAVVLSGSSAGVYEGDEHPWIDDEQALVRELVDRGVPTLGVCFGHQLANAALGGAVGAEEMRAGLVEADLADDPLFDGVGPVVPVAHGDVVTATGDGMELLGSAPYYDAFATRHETAPLWSVQFHPEFTAGIEATLRAQYDWDDGGRSLGDVTAVRVLENFARLVEERPEVAERATDPAGG